MKFKREEGGSEFPADKKKQKASLLEKMREGGIPPMGEWDEVDGQPVEETESEPGYIDEDVLDMFGRPTGKKKRRQLREFEAAMPEMVTGAK